MRINVNRFTLFAFVVITFCVKTLVRMKKVWYSNIKNRYSFRLLCVRMR